MTPARTSSSTGASPTPTASSATDGYNANAFVFGDTPEFATYQSWTGDLRAVIHAPLGLHPDT